MRQFIYTLSLFFVVVSCKTEVTPDAKNIVDKAIEVSGGETYSNSIISFDFRGRHYKATREQGVYQFERVITDSIRTIKDILFNDGFKRFINEEEIKVADSMVPRYSASVNSVHYFSVLPFGLNDAAVNKEYLGEVKIKGKTYYKIKVFFNQEGGGEDFEDVFVYWFDKENYKLDYLAYSYEEGSGIGLRFREAYNERFINGIRFVDYNNYKPEKSITDVFALDSLFVEGKLTLLSKIENENIKVK